MKKLKASQFPVILVIGFFGYFALFPTTAKAESPGFGPATHYSLNRPYGVILADLNSDGFEDMVALQYLVGHLSVYKNKGDGTFASPTSPYTGVWPFRIAAVDLDNDGDLDLAIANAIGSPTGNGDHSDVESNTISILINNGDATFEPVRQYGIGKGTSFIDYGDFDQDGDIDLVTPNIDNDNVLIMNNNGDGTFVYGALYDVGDSPSGTNVSDFDQDGDLDILATNGLAGTVSLLYNNGSGVFDNRVDYHSGEWPQASIVADLDGQYGIDAATTNFYSQSVSVFLNNGVTLSSECKQYNTELRPQYPEYGDIDLDGDLDLVVDLHATDRIAILVNQGNGTFNGPLIYDSEDATVAVALGDVDNDGDLDMAIADYWGNKITVRLNQLIETGTFPSPTNSAYVGDCDALVDPLRITTEGTLPSGTIGEPYRVAFEATGGVAPYTWGISAGELPPGLVLDDASGELSGTPTVAGTYGFTVQVVDVGGRSSTRIYTFDPPPSSGSHGSPYNQQIHIDPTPNDQNDNGGTCSNYTVVSGSLPDGLTLDPATGVVSGTPIDSGAFEFTVACTIDNGPLQGQAAYKNFTIVIVSPNLPPTVDANDPFEADEGDEVTLTATGSDPDEDHLTYDWDLNNDGVYETPGQSVVFSAAEIDGPTTQTIHVRATDPEGLSDQDSTQITINNVAPSVGAIDVLMDPFAVDTAVSFSAEFTDPGIYDTHTAVWDWGDGNTTPGTVNETNGSGNVSDSHAYTTPGVYMVRLTVTDDDTGVDESIYQYVVIYDPEGGFVTGGGWIDSPAGAYAPDPTRTGKANFGFVAKYKKGDNTPTGQTEFQFQLATLTFHSTSYNWLVVAGAKAQYKGVGTINGSGTYGFMITAIDGAINGGGGSDKFRIKIWDKNNGDTLVYDNKLGASEDSDAATEIGGGSIVIHKGNNTSNAASNSEKADATDNQMSVFLPLINR